MTKIIGITGSIASGKSTVVGEIRKHGYKVIDADQIVHNLQEKGGKLYQALLEWLGADILSEDGRLNRFRLGQIIFSSPENLAKSAKLQNQIIRQELMEQRDKLMKTEEIFFMDIPLLIELNYLDWFDQIWLVYVDTEIQKERLILRNKHTSDEADRRISSQMSAKQKKNYADVVIDNSGSLEETIAQVEQALQTL